MSANLNVSIIVPAFNEEPAIKKVVESLMEIQNGYEIIVVDDGSSDDTGLIAKEAGAKVVSHHCNKGYGATLKTGAKNASNDVLVFFDGDGQHNTADIHKLLEFMPDCDFVMGARTNLRQLNLFMMPGRFALKKLANYLSANKVQDINSGLLAIRKDRFLKYTPLLPDGFSCSTTILLTMLTGGYRVEFCPIQVTKREGKSTVRPIRDGFNTVLSMVRLISLFNPLKIFLPTAIFLLSTGIVYGFYKFLTVQQGLSVGALLLIISGIVVFLFGILCDQISALRLENYK